MQITLFQNSRPLNHTRRTFTAPVTISGYLREGCDIFDPEIEIEYNASLLSYNYAQIPDYGNRFYSVIMNSHCIAERSSSNYELMLEDSAVSAVAGYELFSRSLPYSFRPDQGIYVLIVAGG